MGDNLQAQERLARAIALAKEVNHNFSLSIAYGFKATIELFNSDYGQALQYSNLSYKTCREGNFRVWLAHSQMIKGRSMAALGDTDLALQEMELAYRAWVSTGAVLTRPFYLALRGDTLAQANRPDEAAVLFDEALALIASNGESFHESEILRLRAGLCNTSEKQKRDMLTRARDLATAQGKTRYAIRSAMALCKLSIPGAINAVDYQALNQLTKGAGSGAEWDEAKKMLKLVNRIEESQWQ